MVQASVAVLMATYNGETFLDEQLKSIAAQEGVRVALHVRDDGSSDETLAVLARYADTWPALAGLSSGPNLGAAASFMALLRAASGEEHEYFAFCDQDDVWLPSKLSRAVELLSASDAALPLLYCSRVACVDASLAALACTPVQRDTSFAHLLFENIAFGCSVVMNRAARALLVAKEPGRAMVMHDWWAALVVAAFGRVIFDDFAGVLYRQHGKNVVGAETTRLGEIKRHLARLRRNPSALYPIHAQAEALLAHYGDALPGAARERAARLVASKRSFAARAVYAVTGEVARAHKLDELAARALILAGCY